MKILLVWYLCLLQFILIFIDIQWHAAAILQKHDLEIGNDYV
jgi:hypothetical protein